MANCAVFLDRDGVIIEDAHLLIECSRIRILECVPQSLQSLRRAGFRLIVISNQTVVSCGLATEQDVIDLHAEVQYSLNSSVHSLW
jgi:histidinol phosphatase-like enzyme